MNADGFQTRDYKLDELGDPHAPVGSRLWAMYVGNEIRKAYYDNKQTGIKLVELCELFEKNEGWRPLGFSTMADFTKQKLQTSIEQFRQTLNERLAQRAAAAPELGKHGGDRTVQGDNCNLDRGNDADYLTARIRRDRPDIYAKMTAGEYRSARAAAIDAGIVKPQTRYSLPDDPVKAAVYLSERVDGEWLSTFVDEIARRIR